ncbi:sugar phosphate isomerase/epimerase family protein [Falsigemmobacter faecalis]|uniref:Sugar phosphate isomerase/epimerase n=1 Tax=Falsigemmobacter faecalis TaxID=2488730 RepID=A0A3P3DV29_9RHOB|nr:sugar phosphate isomerase/epimerase family protein [Falsigemmobacter faecalis]RRH78123.1 sugar phosphate isomerase/epimerase [Falsigemmobacter faecalis]
MPDRPLLGAALQGDDLERLGERITAEHRDVELQDFFMAEVLNGDWRPEAARIKALLSGWRGRLGIHGPFWGIDMSTPDPEVRVIVTRRMMQALDVCDHMGADQMVVHSPYTPWDYHTLDHFAFRSAYDWLIANCRASMDPVVRRAEALGVEIVLENVQDKDPDIRGTLARAFDSAAMQVSLDTGHAEFAHGSFGAPPVDYYIRRAGAQLRHVHLQDSDGYADRHWPPGEGRINWPAVFRALHELEVMPRLILELSDKSQIPAAIDWLAAKGLAR